MVVAKACLKNMFNRNGMMIQWRNLREAWRESLQLYEEMRCCSIQPNTITCSALIWTWRYRATSRYIICHYMHIYIIILNIHTYIYIYIYMQSTIQLFTFFVYIYIILYILLPDYFGGVLYI